MLRVDITKCVPGMKLAMPVRHPSQPRRTLLKFAFTLDQSSIDRLREVGVRVVWVDYPNLSFLEKIVDPQVIASQGQIVENVAKTIESVQRQATARIPYHAYTRAIGDLVSNLIANPQAAVFMGDLAGGDAGDLMRHSTTVTYISVLIGLKLEGYLVRQRRHIDPARAKEVNSLGLGAMMHDIGVLHLPEEVRDAYAATGDENDPKWREHPSVGFELVRGNVDPSAATVVLNHHQRFDGSGYAGGNIPALAGERIHIFARICGAVEQFDRMRFPAGKPPVPAVAVLGEFLKPGMFRKFDPHVVRALFAVVPPYPPGSMVKLSDDRWAVVIEHTPRDPCRPTVQVIPPPGEVPDPDAEPGETINLSEVAKTLMIVEHEGFDVTDLNFARRALLQDDLSKALYY